MVLHVLGKPSSIDDAQALLDEMRQALPTDLPKGTKDLRIAEQIGWDGEWGARRIKDIRLGRAGLFVTTDFLNAAEAVQLRMRTDLSSQAVLARIDRLEAEIAELRKALAGG